MSLWCEAQIVVTLQGEGDPEPQRIVVRQPFARVGSHTEAEVRIPNQSLAARCLYLHATAAGIYCVRLDLEGSDFESRGRWLRPDEVVLVGNYQLRAALLDSADAELHPAKDLRAKGSAPLPQPVLEIYCGGRLKDIRLLQRALHVLGRRSLCSPKLVGPKVSEFHCALYWDGTQLWCIDLNSTAGTRLGGQPIAASALAMGQRVEVGEFEIALERLSHNGGGGTLPSGQPERESVLPSSNLGLLMKLQCADETTGSPPPRDAAPAPHAPEPSTAELDRLAQEVAHLKQERAAAQSHWEEVLEEFEGQVPLLRQAAADATERCAAMSKSQQAWHAEREMLVQTLTERTQEVARLKAQLSKGTQSRADQAEWGDAAPSRPAPLEQLPQSAGSAATAPGRTVEGPPPARLVDVALAELTKPNPAINAAAEPRLDHHAEVMGSQSTSWSEAAEMEFAPQVRWKQGELMLAARESAAVQSIAVGSTIRSPSIATTDVGEIFPKFSPLDILPDRMPSAVNLSAETSLSAEPQPASAPKIGLDNLPGTEKERQAAHETRVLDVADRLAQLSDRRARSKLLWCGVGIVGLMVIVLAISISAFVWLF